MDVKFGIVPIDTALISPLIPPTYARYIDDDEDYYIDNDGNYYRDDG